MELYRKSATELAALLRAKEVSAADIARSTLARIHAAEPQVDAFLTICEEGMLAEAAEIDKQLAAGKNPGPLAGIPVGLKDNFCTRGVRTTCASRMLENFVPFYDATAVEKLREAGAVFPGKLNMDEFAMGSSNESSYFKPTKNPWNTSCVPGGSSGGSTAAVAACEVPLALGTDTGGSVRGPASFCGVVGLKPTYGAISRSGVVALASSLDHVGPVARTVDDVALLFAALCGDDRARDATSVPCTFPGVREDALKGLRIGVPREFFDIPLQDDVREVVKKAIAELETQGAVVEELSIPSLKYALPAYHAISTAEAASNFARFDGVKYGFAANVDGGLDDLYIATRSQGFGDEVKRRIMLGTFVLSSGNYDKYYKRACLTRQMIVRELDEAFGRYDLMVSPTCATTAFPLGARLEDPVHMYSSDACIVPANIAGLPAVSVPCGLSEGGLPVGLHMVGPRFSEGLLLGAAKGYETAVGGFAVKEMGI